MKDVRERLIQIHGCDGITWKLLEKFFRFDASLSFTEHLTAHLMEKEFGVKKERSEKIIRSLNQQQFSHRMTEYNRKQIHPVTIFDPHYPAFLKEIYDPPWLLYCIGDLSILNNRKMLSVVGTRCPSNAGLEILEKLIRPLVEQEWTIISGLAYGIDVQAHRLAIKSSTIAVLGSGFDHIYPKEHQALADQLASSHLLVSEYPPHLPTKPWQFPQRNRIISGLSKGTLVIEAKEKSGTLITADQALEQGRDVFAVPGSILEPRSYGTNRLIQQGAKLVMNTEDITSELGNV